MHHLAAVRTIARYTVLDAARSRVAIIVVLALCAALALSGFLAQVAITETVQIQSALMASFLRWAAVFIVSLAVITGMVREFNDKGFELVLSLPLPRGGYYFGKLLGYAALAIAIAVCASMPLLFVAPVEQVALWGISLTCELLIVCTLSLVCMLTLQQTLPAFTVVMAFYLLARSIGAIQLIGHGPLADSSTLSQQVLNVIVAGIAAVLPSLEQFTRTDWLVYAGAGPVVLAPVIAQSAIYLALLVGAGLFDLYRKNL